jgi:hypothetical protein
MHTGNSIQDCRGKSSIQKGESSFYQQIGLKFKAETGKCYIWSMALCGAEILTLGKLDQKTGKVLNCCAGS